MPPNSRHELEKNIGNKRVYNGRFGAYSLIICFTLNLAIWIFNLKRNVCFKVLSFFLNLLMLYLFIWVCVQVMDFAFTRDPRADVTLDTLKFVFTMFCPEKFCPAINFSSYESPF
ncbi:hypothetical protein CEXT_469011 [Caerostris extrusa]|uniref:Uncharacterized protein n=1 Tax=Caerostris extrusa TaxID=172846 RepID=A0AAV4Q7J8_CAEEX|nr:hypothetical protein CEXT_469011 [Caerostris extrusa]